MSQTIKTYADLCEERDRVKSLLVIQRQKIKDDWSGSMEAADIDKYIIRAQN